MTYWLVIPLLGLVVILQTTLVPYLTVAGYKADLPLLVIVTWGLLGAPGEAAVWGFVTGLFLDLMSGLPFGTQTLAMTGIGLLMSLAQTTISRSNVILPPAATALATVGYDVLILAILNTLGWQIDWSDYMLHIVLPTAILNSMALPFVYVPMQRVVRRLRPRVEW